MPLPNRILIDTSAFYALISTSDSFHQKARETYERIIDREQELWTTSYVLIETIALVHHRLGFQALSEFMSSIGHVSVFWIENTIHNEAWERLSAIQGRLLSFVDWTAALVSRVIDAHIFTFDGGFAEQGFTILPR